MELNLYKKLDHTKYKFGKKNESQKQKRHRSNRLKMKWTEDFNQTATDDNYPEKSFRATVDRPK